MDLNITNGDSATALMQEAGIAGVLLPWRDVLHDGPVPAGLTLEALSDVRARFIADCGWGDRDAIRAGFTERDETLTSCENYSRVRLWFEHDLYDQLQLLQILDWFNAHPSPGIELSLICTDNYLGMLTPVQMLALQQYETPVTAAQLQLASRAWTALCSPSPLAWQALREEDTQALPFLDGAVVRLLEEYPGCANGLSRTAQAALDIISRGEDRPGKVFARYQETESRRFLGDASFWILLNAMLGSDPPLLSASNGKPIGLPVADAASVTITPAGRQVLRGERHMFDIAPPDRWIGGVHLRADNAWCWNADLQTLSQVWD